MLSDLARTMSPLSMQVGNSSSAILETQKKEALMSDAAMESLRELHSFMSDLKHQYEMSHQASQYATIQHQIDDVRRAIDSQVMHRSESSASRESLLLRSRNNLMRVLIGADNTGATLKSGSVFAYGYD